MNQIRLILVFLALLAILPAAGVGFETASAKSSKKQDTLRVFFWQAPTILNPHLSLSDKEVFVSRIVYEPLASYDEQGKMVPLLAAAIPSLDNGGVAPDGTSVTWKLKAGVRWADGEPFTADDVLFTYEFITDPEIASPATSIYESIKRVEVIDDLTVKLHFKDVNPTWSIPFVGQFGSILPRHAFVEYKKNVSRQANANTRPIGTGPYYVEAFNVEDMLMIGRDTVKIVKIVFKSNPNFREPGKPYFDRLVLHGGGDAAIAARTLLVDGSVDFAWNLQVEAEKLSEMEEKGYGKVKASFGPYVERILVNFTDPNRATKTGERSSLQFPHPFLSDKRVRQALAHAIDREAIARLYGNMARSTHNILVVPPQFNSPNTVDLYPFDLTKAAKLLDEAGWQDSDGDGVRDKNGISMHILYQTSVNPIRQQTQQLIKRTLKSIGVQVEVKAIDASIFFSDDPTNTNTARLFYADLEEYYNGNSTPAPDVYLRFWRCDEVAQEANNWSGTNFNRWCHDEYDALAERLLTEVDPEKRRQAIIRMNDLQIEEVVMIPLVQRALTNGVSNTLFGVELTQWDSPFWKIKDWRRK